MLVLKPERPRLRLIETGNDVAAGPADDMHDEPSWPRGSAADAVEMPYTPSDTVLRQRYYARQQEVRRLSENVDRLRYAVVDLASIDLPPAQIIEAMSPGFDEPIVRDRLARAADCLMRFIEEWERHEVTRRPRQV